MRERRWSQLPFYDPKGLLVELHKVSLDVAQADLPYNLSSLRTNSLNRYREGRQCALFCYGIGQRLETEVRFAFSEEQDIDFVSRYEVDEVVHLVPLQMKEVVPQRVRDAASLQEEIDKLSKYGDSSDLVVAFHLNRDARIVPQDLDFSRAKVREIWIVGSTGKDEEWLLLGNMIGTDPRASVFRYPEP